MATNQGHSTATEWTSKDAQADQDTTLRSQPTESLEQNEIIAPLPRPGTKESTTSSHTSPTLQNTRSFLGLHPIAPIDKEHDTADHSDLWWPRVRMSLKEPFAEFWGTFVLVLIGDAGVAQVLLSQGQKSAPGQDGFGDYQSINWGWAIGVMLGIYVAGDSGAFLNPAILLTNCVFRKLPWRRFPAYFIAQLLGGFAASGVVYFNYIDSINNFAGHNVRTTPPATTATAQIFCTYPQAQMTRAGMFLDEFVASALLMFVIFALKDDSNKGSFSASGEWFPLGLFFLIFAIGSTFGYQTGYAINIARDFGPRIMSDFVGYGHEVWSTGGYYFWIPMVAPFIGCLFGGLLYDIFIYTGPSPINSPYFGLMDLVKPKESVQKRMEDHKKENIV